MTHDIVYALAAAQPQAIAGRLSEATRLLHEVLASDPAQGHWSDVVAALRAAVDGFGRA
ncbi:hypothetical protein [Burkholderia plantarii]|uniref:hypothetical protein n=1 Tax=Burkholderia plantarii TaxID=41899 RepID=UPI0018DBE140|nr:hypothetical protein [Burkholderia plantarii]MBI0328744.1 hypothetical protein [Burkholderia plantarii]